MRIRSAAPGDIPSLVLLFEAYRAFYRQPPAPGAAANFLQERIENRDAEIFVAESDGGELAGFVQLYPLFSSTRMKRLWLLNDLYVAPAYRGKGISVLLIDKAKELCRQSGSAGMMLETAKTNDIGNQLYPRAGFTLDDEHNYYSWDNE
jgi:ribosomal protein S18 acetylase RimI-like enzyme